MAKRKYSVEEIDIMRTACRALNGYSTGNHAIAEEMLRTYMLNGTDPQDLRKAADVFLDQCIRMQEARQRAQSREWVG